ncbi:CmcI family methyltransferase [Parasphingopyxis marina]|uniref:Cephalosporin hydroxylase n=1 Tax=Parasphingopyxis marina TaxID=2761622 RepID=A0A842HYF9_9SPHN|nr:CmcI family methyltransferase [Parasphingopyxis marina]MBC2777497.1 cephalosporin hydroxylase [Parasphingopyxis marina]
MDGARQAVSVRDRNFAVDLPAETLARIQDGVLRSRYKGRRFCKNPFDVMLYLQLLERLRPKTIIEIGTSEGGSALWFHDQCAALQIECAIYSFDLDPPADPIAPGVHCLKGDALDPQGSFPADIFRSAPHPWLIVEDSAHSFESVLAVLRYFDSRVIAGDYVVVEDGIVADLPGDRYRAFEDGPNRAVATFLAETGEKYAIDEARCDFYGHNVTYCPNAWLEVR